MIIFFSSDFRFAHPYFDLLYTWALISLHDIILLSRMITWSGTVYVKTMEEDLECRLILRKLELGGWGVTN